ncbi:MAG TPA: hypothetical protein VH300_01945 [Thermoleophilaceae bacterium]|jgi:hypothetical protein|nr:hypothetical protein [Thermoleophilaceae bacterium]
MADRLLMISWGETVRGREERALEVFNESVGLAGRMQQDGRIESFDVVLLSPNGGITGYLEMHGSAQQIAAIQEDQEFQRNTVDASLIVEDLRHTVGFTNEGVAQQMALYQEAVAKVPQAS